MSQPPRTLPPRLGAKGASSSMRGTIHPLPPGMPRLLPAHGSFPLDVRAHQARHGPVPYRGRPEVLIAEVEAAGLTGRGGAAFPTHRKLAAARGYRAAPIVVANGAEGEPASRKDKSLLWLAPHLVLDGLQLAGEATGAAAVGIYVHRNGRLHARLAGAITERNEARADRYPVELFSAPPRFLAGEESALASVISGGPALPRYRPPRAAARGLANQPTLVQNAETLAHLALIARYGAGWFRSAGTAAEPGSMLATLHCSNGQIQVIEAELGTPLAGLPLLRTPAGDPLAVGAVLAGGYHGAWLTAAEARQAALANEDLRPLGAALGAGVLAALPAGRCGVAETARVARYLALESAGQ